VFYGADKFNQLLCSPTWQNVKSVFQASVSLFSRVLCCDAGSHLIVDNPLSNSGYDGTCDGMGVCNVIWTTPDDQACGLCPHGQYSSSLNIDRNCTPAARDMFVPAKGMNTATNCSDNSYTNPPNSTLCEMCPAGYHMDHGPIETACHKCDAGRFQNVPGKNTCNDCSIGFYQNEIGIPYCIGCIPGQFQDETGMGGCKDCDAGKKAETPGTIQCGECDVGYTSGKGSARCLPCEAGMFMGVGQSSCKNCFPGQYRENKKGSDSTAVDTGTGTGTGGTSGTGGIGGTGGTGGTATNGTATTGTATTGTATTGTATTGTATTGTATTGTGTAGGLDESTDPTTCVDCPTGWASDSGSTKCQRCEAGKKAIEGGGPGCTICPQHQYRESHERDSDGVFLPLKPTDPTTCVECPAGWRSDAGIGAGATKCDSCDAGRFSDHVLDPENSEDCLDCAEGKYRESKEEDGITITNPTKCLDCPTGWMSKGGSTRCQACGAGTFGDGCKSCPIGYARNRTDPDATQCRLCQLGETTTLIGSASCERW
jgi:hypothetical protein